ncbi:hypothetical protein [Allohahella marinimesophila]|uniref:AMP-binding protein n=1 Tax=Allohahella marinimesophila TaxID=1054972 RepID=A0ABP7Q8K1_9GAMM
MNNLISKYLFFYPATLLKGERVASYLREAREFQFKSSEEIERHQLRQLNKLLKHAYETTAYYNSTLGIKSSGPLNSLAELKAIPLLDKKQLIENFTDICSSKKFRLVTTKTTGGSTGQAVTLRKNSYALAKERAVTARGYEWAGVKIGAPQARLWGIPLEVENRLYYKVVDLIANRKRISAFNLTSAAMKNYLETLQTFQPHYLYGYASAIEEFVRFLYNEGCELPKSIKSIISTSEVLTPTLRENIRQFSGLQVFNEYGCGEVGSIAHECAYGSLHLMADNLIVEVLDEVGQPANEGELVVTDLYNYATPLIRYRLKDFGTLDNKSCECGATLPVLKEIHGRAYDMILTRSGRKYHPEILMYVFESFKKQNLGIDQFQVVQNDFELFTISIVAGAGYSRAAETTILAKVQEVLEMPVTMEFLYVQNIEREPSGKIRLIKSEIASRANL